MSRATGYTPLARGLHWAMAAAILAMLFIGVAMVSTLSPWHLTLEGLHRPLGILILLLAVLRLGVRLRRGTPALPQDLPRAQRTAARLSHGLLYALMLGMPLIGWAMVSASGVPVRLGELAGHTLSLPGIAPVSGPLYGVLRSLHGVLAGVLFVTVLVHLAAALAHGWIRRDGVLTGMLRGRRRDAA